MKIEQEPKYEAVNQDGVAFLRNRASGEFIPDDEPVFIFRARDIHALAALNHYLAEICKDPIPAHLNAVCQSIKDFERFAAQHPERMKVPDSP